ETLRTVKALSGLPQLIDCGVSLIATCVRFREDHRRVFALVAMLPCELDGALLIARKAGRDGVQPINESGCGTGERIEAFDGPLPHQGELLHRRQLAPLVIIGRVKY